MIRLIEFDEHKLNELVGALRPKHGFEDKISKVRGVIEDVIHWGDDAVINYTQKFDRITLSREELRVQTGEIKKAFSQVSKEEVQAMKQAKRNIEKVESLSLKRLAWSAEVQPGIKVKSYFKPIESVGCYIPGGRAAYPSSLLMAAVPAQVAGVERIVLCSPPSRMKEINPHVLVAASICGIEEIYRVGGSQAIAALAYGTQTIKPVQKIVGPGNPYITAAKLLVSSKVSIDLPSGPCEVLIVADETANVNALMAEIISQAEHGGESICGLLTTSTKLAMRVIGLLPEAVRSASKREIVFSTLSNFGFALVCKKTNQIIDFVNAFAPEHLRIVTKKPEQITEKINNAGLILVGDHSPVAASDYLVGTNHILPTGGYAKIYSGLSSLAFLKQIHLVQCSPKGLKKLVAPLRTLALAEGLPNHALAVEKKLGGK